MTGDKATLEIRGSKDGKVTRLDLVYEGERCPVSIPKRGWSMGEVWSYGLDKGEELKCSVAVIDEKGEEVGPHRGAFANV